MFLALVLLGHFRAEGQSQEVKPKVWSPGYQAAIHVGGQVPAGPLANRFGPSNTVGLSAYRIAESGWRWGCHYRFQTGSEVREPGLLGNLTDPSGLLVDNEGRIALVTPQQRGTVLAFSVGRLLTASAFREGSGWLAELAFGFWEHKVHFQNRGNRITQLEEPYLAGYDRLTGGWMIAPRFGYSHDARNGLVRFQAGLEAMFGRLQPNRTWNVDTMTTDAGPRADRTVGLFAAWILRLKARSTEVDYYH
jgi:hypothetical protein